MVSLHAAASREALIAPSPLPPPLWSSVRRPLPRMPLAAAAPRQHQAVELLGGDNRRCRHARAAGGLRHFGDIELRRVVP